MPADEDMCLKKELLCEGLLSYLSSSSFSTKLPGGVKTLLVCHLVYASRCHASTSVWQHLPRAHASIMHVSTLHSRVSVATIAVLIPKALRRGNGIVLSCVTVVSQLCTYEVQESFSQVNGIQRRRDTECRSA